MYCIHTQQRPGWHLHWHWRAIKYAAWYHGRRHYEHINGVTGFVWREVWFDFFIVSLVATRYCGE